MKGKILGRICHLRGCKKEEITKWLDTTSKQLFGLLYIWSISRKYVCMYAEMFMNAYILSQTSS